MSKFGKEFKEFISRGSVMDLAVGMIMGTAFTAIINSLVNDILMPVIGLICGGIDFSGLTATVGDASINYGMFIQNIINFLLIALCLFFIIKGLNALKRKTEKEKKEAPAEPSEEVKLLTEIRDSLKK